MVAIMAMCDVRYGSASLGEKLAAEVL